VKRYLAAAAALVMLSSMVGCAASPAPFAAPAPSTSALNGVDRTPAPDVVDVVCSAAGTSVSAARVIAGIDGVHIRARNTSRASGIYLNYNYGGGWRYGGGDPVNADASVRVLSLPPGPVRLNCSSAEGEKRDRPVQLEVQDPARAWRAGALATFGCTPPQFSTVDWVIGPGSGPTADAALTALVAQMDRPTTWVAAQEGYVAATTQTYVMERDGKPWVTASVTRTAASVYSASLGAPCRGAA
jgi:hypothetical protein